MTGMRAGALAALLLALGAPCSRAQDAQPPSYVDEFAGELDAYAETLAALPPSSPECRAAYAPVYARNPLTIGVFLGYIDTGRRNYVADRDFKQALLRRLTAACRGSLAACGFAAAPGDAAPNETRLVKSLDGRKIALEVFDSSVSGDRAASLTSLAGEQRDRSGLAEEQFLAALRRDAVVLYTGHTRRFSDAGFFPPLGFSRLALASLLRRPFFSRVYDALRPPGSGPAVLGLFACHSREYYAGRIHALSPGTALIVGADSSGHENSLLSLLGAVNAVLARSCYAEAARGMDADERAPVFRVYGLFDRAPHPRYTRYLDGRLVVVLLLLIPLAGLSVPRRREPGAARPAAAAHGPWRAAGFLLLALVPCALVVRAAAVGATWQLPLLLSSLGLLTLALALARRRLSAGQLGALAGQAWPALAVFLAVYLCCGLARELSAENALSSVRQAAAFALAFWLLWPFALVSEEALVAPFLGEDSPGAVAACVHALVFYLAVWLALCALAPVYKPRLWPIPAFALYACVLSFALHRRRGPLAPAVAQALTLALVVTEGLHALIYN